LGIVELAAWHMWWKRSGARELRQILLDEWDPIGVVGILEAADEYDSYLGQIAERLRNGESGDQIGEYLRWVEEEQMGLGATTLARERDRELGARLVAWYSEATGTE
jgi:hypothetical protein